MRAETAHSRADGGASPDGHRPMPAEQPGHVFVDERGRRTRVIRWLGRGMTALAGLYIAMLVGGALFGVSIVPRLSLPRVTLPFAAPRAADPGPPPVAQASADAQPEAGPRPTGAPATAATAQAATAGPAALRLSSAPGGSRELPAAPAPSPSAPVDAPATPATAPTPGQQGQEVAGAHGGGKDKAKEEAGGPPADPTTDGATDGTTDGTGRGSPKGRTAA